MDAKRYHQFPRQKRTAGKSPPYSTKLLRSENQLEIFLACHHFYRTGRGADSAKNVRLRLANNSALTVLGHYYFHFRHHESQKTKSHLLTEAENNEPIVSQMIINKTSQRTGGPTFARRLSQQRIPQKIETVTEFSQSMKRQPLAFRVLNDCEIPKSLMPLPDSVISVAQLQLRRPSGTVKSPYPAAEKPITACTYFLE